MQTYINVTIQGSRSKMLIIVSNVFNISMFLLVEALSTLLSPGCIITHFEAQEAPVGVEKVQSDFNPSVVYGPAALHATAILSPKFILTWFGVLDRIATTSTPASLLLKLVLKHVQRKHLYQ